MTIFLINFQENPENGCGAMWRYLFQTLENHQKMPNMKGINTYDHFV